MSGSEKREKNRIKNIEWRKNNKEKYLRSAAQYRKNNREKISDYKLSTRYKITLKEYYQLCSDQHNKCDICKQPEKARHNKTKKIQRLAVDHCHRTGKVRGLLCQDCNRGISKFYEDTSKLASAISYLKKHE